jgi:hypothetical protein
MRFLTDAGSRFVWNPAPAIRDVRRRFLRLLVCVDHLPYPKHDAVRGEPIVQQSGKGMRPECFGFFTDRRVQAEPDRVQIAADNDGHEDGSAARAFTGIHFTKSGDEQRKNAG